MARETTDYSSGEVTRQIESLWDSHRRLEVKQEVNNKEIMALSTQMPYVVALLEKIESVQSSQVPVCAVRGQRLDTLEAKIVDTAEASDDHEERIARLEGTNKILAWITGLATTILVMVGAEKLARYIE